MKFKKLYRKFQEATQTQNLKAMGTSIAEINNLEVKENLWKHQYVTSFQGSYAQLINDHEGARLAFTRALDLDEDQDGAYLTESQGQSFGRANANTGRF